MLHDDELLDDAMDEEPDAEDLDALDEDDDLVTDDEDDASEEEMY